MAKQEKNLTPMDIHNKEFTRRGRSGYDRYEVDKFLDEIIDDYGDALDQVVDLKNKQVELEEKLEQVQETNQDLNNQLTQLQARENEVNSVLLSAQQSAEKIRQDAQNQANEILANAQNEAQIDSQHKSEQIATLSNDYDRLKQKVGQERQQLQALLQRQIDDLNDDRWQQALDKYFDSSRYYPEDGSEPIETVEDTQDESDSSESLESIDKPSTDELESSQGSEDTNSGNNDAPTIIFPDNYKNHN